VKRKKMIWMLALVLLIFHQAEAGDIEYPKQTWQNGALEAVRAWEQKWAGEKIDSARVDDIKELLPESLYHLMKDRDTWGDSWFVIAPYRQIAPTNGERQLTISHAGEARLGTSDELCLWTAGIPFPEPKNGLEIAHNFKRRNNGDSIENSTAGFIVDGKLNYDMQYRSVNRYLFWAGRFDMPPVPELPGNTGNIWRTSLSCPTEPPENRNVKTIEVQYKDEMKPYDSWTWLPAARRVQRRTSSAREDSSGGSDFCEYDSMGWDGPVQINTYRLIGQKDFLWARHTDTAKLQRMPGSCLWSGAQRERLSTYIIEVKNKNPNFLYSKQVWYIDPETWQILYAERYDRSGRLWRILDQFFFIGRGYGGAELGQYTAIQSIDIEKVHATILKSDMKFGLDYPLTLFNKDYLQKNGY